MREWGMPRIRGEMHPGAIWEERSGRSKEKPMGLKEERADAGSLLVCSHLWRSRPGEHRGALTISALFTYSWALEKPGVPLWPLLTQHHTLHLGDFPEINMILPSVSHLTSVIHRSLQRSAVLNIQGGVWQSEGREIKQIQKRARQDMSNVYLSRLQTRKEVHR